MAGPRRGNSETNGYIGLHNYTRPVPPNSPIPTTGPILRYNFENRTSFQTKDTCAVPIVEEIAGSGNTF